jgi:hypothetical protein
MSSLRPSHDLLQTSLSLTLSGVGVGSDFRFEFSPLRPANFLLGPSGCGKTLALSLIAAAFQGCLPSAELPLASMELAIDGITVPVGDWITRRCASEDVHLPCVLSRNRSVGVRVAPPGCALREIPIRRVTYVSPHADPGGLWPVSEGAHGRAQRLSQALCSFPFVDRIERLEAAVSQFDAALAAYEEWSISPLGIPGEWAHSVASQLDQIRLAAGESAAAYLGDAWDRFEDARASAKVAALSCGAGVAVPADSVPGRLLDTLRLAGRALAGVVADPEHAAADRALANLNRFLRSLGTGLVLDIAGDGSVVLADNDGELVDMATLSPGLSHGIALWVSLSLAPPGTLLLIDDPETNLDIRWRSAFWPQLKSILSERGCWAVVSTHCPAILNSRVDLAVEPGGARR